MKNFEIGLQKKELLLKHLPHIHLLKMEVQKGLMELAWAMIIAKNLPVFLWDEAVMHAAYLWNCMPT